MLIRCVVCVFIVILHRIPCFSSSGIMRKQVIPALPDKISFEKQSNFRALLRIKRNTNVQRSDRTCCDVFPNICDDTGNCVLDIGVCVQLCVCATAVSGDWCTEVINLLTSSSSSVTSAPASIVSPLFIVKSVENNNISTLYIKTSSLDDVMDTKTQLPNTFIVEPYPINSVDKYANVASSEHVLLPSVYPLVAPPVTNIVLQSRLTDVLLQTQYQNIENIEIDTPKVGVSQIMPTTVSLPDSNSENNTMVESSCSDCSDGICVLTEKLIPICIQQVDMTSTNSSCPPGFLCKNGLCIIDNGKVQCKCHRKWTGSFCDDPCLLDCGEHGLCVIHDTEVCVCQWNYTGEFCEEFDATRNHLKGPTIIRFSKTPWSIVGICLGLLAILLIMFLILPYLMYRKRWLPIRKLVHYFQEYEDDDGKEYDAFVSYKACKNDEEFVVHKLYPQLEKILDFKLCLHFRDFLPGEAIANSIIQAIENSRRTIMVLTPNYIASEWCRLEYQKAQHEMLKLKHKIIPIILEDISTLKDVDKNLKSILDTVTYIEWPPDENTKEINKFWKMLELTMPKRKRGGSNESPSSQSSSSEVPLTSVTSLSLSDTLCDDVFSDVTLERSLSIPIQTDNEPKELIFRLIQTEINGERLNREGLDTE